MFTCLTVSSLRVLVNKACWVSLGRSVKAMIVTAESHCCLQIWDPSGVQVEMSILSISAISEERNGRFGPFVVTGLALPPVVV